MVIFTIFLKIFVHIDKHTGKKKRGQHLTDLLFLLLPFRLSSNFVKNHFPGVGIYAIHNFKILVIVFIFSCNYDSTRFLILESHYVHIRVIFHFLFPFRPLACPFLDYSYILIYTFCFVKPFQVKLDRHFIQNIYIVLVQFANV